MPERRNPVVRAGAILRKGGAHTKSVSGQRHRQKLRVDDAIDDWYEDINNQSDADFLMEADSRDQDKSQAGKGADNKGKNKGQSDTAPSLLWCRLSTTNPVNHHSC